jgi:hypothetical protein
MITQIRSQIKESSTGIIISIVAFMLWPLGAFISSIKYAGTRIFSVLMVSFYFLYGYTYIIAGKDQDNFRIAKYFTEWSGLTFDALWSKIITLYELGNKPDLFQDFLQFTVSRFTNNVQVYFAVTATLFGLVAAALFKVVLTTDSKVKRNDFFLVCVTLFLLLVLSPGRINSFRHYFGVAIFTYSLYRYLNGEGFKYLFLLMLTPFIHFAFVMIIPLVLIQKLISNRLYIYYLLIVISFFLSGSVADYLGDFTRSIDESSLQYQAKQYTSEAYLQKVDELKTKRTYILDIYTYATTVYFLFVVVYLAWMTRIKDRTILSIYGMCLLLFVFVNLFRDLESVSNRFGVMFHGLCCILLIRLFTLPNFKVPVFIKATFAVVMIFNAVVILRILAQTASVSTILLFFPISILFPIDVSVLDWIK